MENNIIKLMREIDQDFQLATYDAAKFTEGNNSAGTRVRKYMQSIKSLAQEVRKEVQEQKNAVVA